MASKGRREQATRRAAEGGSGHASTDRRIEHLKRDYEKFRREHRRGTRIPQVLRAAALAALESGASEGQVRRACKISPTQLGWWRRSAKPRGGQFGAGEQQVRVFEVVEDDAEQEARGVSLRVGRWEISIRQL